MIDQKQNCYIVDCESIQIAPDIMNFRYQITWALFDKIKNTDLENQYII